MRKILQSYAISLPAFVLGVVAFAQAANPSLLATADTGKNNISAGPVLMVVGIGLLGIAVFSIIYRYVDKIKR